MTEIPDSHSALLSFFTSLEETLIFLLKRAISKNIYSRLRYADKEENRTSNFRSVIYRHFHQTKFLEERERQSFLSQG